MSEKLPNTEHLNERPISQSEVLDSVDPLSSHEISAIAGARLETMLLDIEENPSIAGESFDDRKSEIESAIEIVNTTKPDYENGLSPSGVIAERIGILKNAIATDKNNARLWEARLAAFELAQGVLTEVFWEPSNKFNDVTQRLAQRGKLTDELYRDHDQAINSDTRLDHNSRVHENEKRRKFLEQKKHIQSIQTRS
jgi:hypothetical protein